MLAWNAKINVIDLQKYFILLSTGKSLYYISNQPFSTTCKHHYKIISQGNGKFLTYTPCLKCHVHNEFTGLRGVYVERGSLVCIINLLISPVGNVLMRLGCQGKGTEDFNGQWLFSNLETIIPKAILVPGNSFLFWRIQYFIT